MAWIRREQLNGEEVLDEVTVDGTVYVQVAEGAAARVSYAKETEEEGDESNGLHSRTELSR